MKHNCFQKVFSELRKDKGLYQAYKANIAMAYIDISGIVGSRDSYKQRHNIANAAAKYFLDLLIKKPEKDKQLPGMMELGINISKAIGKSSNRNSKIRKSQENPDGVYCRRAINDHVLKFFLEKNPSRTDYKMWAEVRDLPGCIIAGDSIKEILKETPKVIENYINVMRQCGAKKI
jgi:predicted RNase H-like HicB family nuclease